VLALLVHQWEHDVGQVEAFGHAGQQVAPLLGQRGANGLQVRAFRKVECVLDVDAEIADRALDLGMAEQS
jgi:hypothetical protein